MSRGVRAASAGDSRGTRGVRAKRPERVGGLVDALLDELGITDRVERAGAAAEWADLVGPHIARITGKVRVGGRTLFVEVTSAAWLTELSMLRRDLLEKVNAGRTRGRIERIVFVQAQGRG